jgi:F0F1-type ATP synthase membrane subunit c/vacuolar-type H+-ATPase subunit K
MIGIVVGLAGTYCAAKFIQAFARDPATLTVVIFVTQNKRLRFDPLCM